MCLTFNVEESREIYLVKSSSTIPILGGSKWNTY
jgi:hypothetical protein